MPLLQGIFLTQGSNLGLLHCRQSPAWQANSLPTGPPEKPFCLSPAFWTSLWSGRMTTCTVSGIWDQLVRARARQAAGATADNGLCQLAVQGPPDRRGIKTKNWERGREFSKMDENMVPPICRVWCFGRPGCPRAPSLHFQCPSLSRVISWLTKQLLSGKALSFYMYFNIFIYLSTLDLSCGMQDPVPWPGVEPGPPALGA